MNESSVKVPKTQLLSDRFRSVRYHTELLCQPLETEDFVVQPIGDVSPPKWHLGHTTWFFEQVILEKFESGFKPYSPQFFYLFNSYYEAFGERTDREQRGTLSRPTVREVLAYRENVTERMTALLNSVEGDAANQISDLTELGIHHEQQHQELLLMDIKNIMASNLTEPIYSRSPLPQPPSAHPPEAYVEFEGGLLEFGHTSDGFSYDNETPRHKQYLAPYRLMNRLVTSGEFLEFIEHGGYADSNLWLSDGWAVIKERRWTNPYYWFRKDGRWFQNTMQGVRPIEPTEPVSHVSFYEAAAFARWRGKRLPTEYEWEHAARSLDESHLRNGNFMDDGHFHPLPATDSAELQQMFGELWEWTGSAYLPYPGYQRVSGALGEYNGKFMSDQMVLRGGCCATPRDHIRATYRNFFQCDKRWPFTGFRLAEDA